MSKRLCINWMSKYNKENLMFTIQGKSGECSIAQKRALIVFFFQKRGAAFETLILQIKDEIVLGKETFNIQKEREM